MEFIDLGARLEERGYVTSAQAAAILGVRREYVDRLVYLGKLTPFLVGRSRFFKRGEVEGYKRDHPLVGTAASRR